MVGHLLGAAGAVEAIATIQVSVAMLEEKYKIVFVHADLSSSFVSNSLISNLDLSTLTVGNVVVQAIRTGWVHPTINLEDPESEVVRASPFQF